MFLVFILGALRLAPCIMGFPLMLGSDLLLAGSPAYKCMALKDWNPCEPSHPLITYDVSRSSNRRTNVKQMCVFFYAAQIDAYDKT